MVSLAGWVVDHATWVWPEFHPKLTGNLFERVERREKNSNCLPEPNYLCHNATAAAAVIAAATKRGKSVFKAKLDGITHPKIL